MKSILTVFVSFLLIMQLHAEERKESSLPEKEEFKKQLELSLGKFISTSIKSANSGNTSQIMNIFYHSSVQKEEWFLKKKDRLQRRIIKDVPLLLKVLNQIKNEAPIFESINHKSKSAAVKFKFDEGTSVIRMIFSQGEWVVER